MYKRISEILFGLAMTLLNVAPAMAQLNVPTPTGVTRFQDVPTAINTIFNFIILLASIAFIILFLVAGIQYLTAAGDEKATAAARSKITDAVVGLIIVLAAFGIGQFILSQLGLRNVNLTTGGN